MITILTWGGVTIAGAVSCYILEELNQKMLATVLSIVLSLVFLYGISDFVMHTVRDILTLFGSWSLL